MKRTLSTLILSLTAIAGFAQEPFSTLELRIQGSRNLNRNILHERWHPASGAKLSVSTPFYAGEWEMNFGFHRFNASTNVPGFGALWINSGWRARIPVHAKVALKPAISIGNYRMSFDDSAFTYAGESSESDFAGSIAMLASLDLSRQWFVFGEAEYLRIQTSPRMHLWFASIGFGFRIQSGKLARTFLE